MRIFVQAMWPDSKFVCNDYGVAFHWLVRGERRWRTPDQIATLAGMTDLATVRQSAVAGCADSQHQLGLCLLLGTAGAADSVEGFAWLKRAAEQGHAQAQVEAGLCALEGLGVQGDVEVSARWFRKSVASGCPDGFYWLGVCHALCTG